ncbi:helix-turn-helix domain-containing protein [Sphingosinicella sp. BN140058]|uniref:helix-turn-helix domain-containing protein n=1 Tax=Sphingosinicella sp. BN140058 TaxID=1892855 RepID=UPI0010103B9D|nr:helix-turn-helix domain-containing protein [Sphingosinicella sp. BN140058]QAY75310.1 helix-turn-helix domain-containing protein [Sphingosinicella sp. BN140058]
MRIHTLLSPEAQLAPQRIAAASKLAWHAHDQAYAAIVLRGAYMEAGDGGRYRAEPGQVLVHPPRSGHANWIDGNQVAVVNVPLSIADGLRLESGSVADPDALRAEILRAPEDAAAIIGQRVRPSHRPEQDLPDLLAAALAAPEAPSLIAWAAHHRVSARTITRHFRSAYGIAPARYRWRVRTLAAWREIVCGTAPLADIAAAAGFADQAHMTRSIATLTGRPPRAWRTPVSV